MKEARLGIDITLERSQSGNGGHAWIFFSESIPAVLARKLGSIIMNQAMRQSSQLKLSSYDRFFPNQDFIPKGGFGKFNCPPSAGSFAREGKTLYLLMKTCSLLRISGKYLSSVQKIFP